MPWHGMEQAGRNMAQMLIRLNVALAGVVLSTSIVSSQQRPLATTAPNAAQQSARNAARGIQSLISGTAVDPDRKPLPNASIRLRDLARNEIVQTVRASNGGEFSFVAAPGVPYLVEVADDAGRVVAIGDVVVANVGEVAGAQVALPSRLRVPATVFSDTASSVRSAAMRAGLVVVDPMLPKLSPTK
jgi:hypothetical protein